LVRLKIDEFDKRPSGLYLPHGKIKQTLNRKRLNRVIWKICRGLYFYEFKKFLPENSKKAIEILFPGYDIPKEYKFLLNFESRGTYQKVFAYKYVHVKGFHGWAMLFLDRIIVFIFFHSPECECDDCLKSQLI